MGEVSVVGVASALAASAACLRASLGSFDARELLALLDLGFASVVAFSGVSTFFGVVVFSAFTATEGCFSAGLASAALGTSALSLALAGVRFSLGLGLSASSDLTGVAFTGAGAGDSEVAGFAGTTSAALDPGEDASGVLLLDSSLFTELALASDTGLAVSTAAFAGCCGLAGARSAEASAFGAVGLGASVVGEFWL